jgi:ring-1,2-phenylacetyl-CoA epoxidase subunit PaaE
MRSSTTVIFAADAGLSPALNVVNRVLAAERTNRVWLFCGHRAGQHIEEIESLLALKDQHLDRLALGVVMEREPDEAPLLSGELDSEKVQALASRFFDAKAVKDYVVCGPTSLLDGVRIALTPLGVDAARIHTESGAAAEEGGAPRAPHWQGPESRGIAPSPAGASETRVSFVMDGRRRSFPMRTGDESILDAATRAGIDLPFSCKAGVCSTCRTKLVHGEVDMAQNYALEDWELAQGFILACQSRAKTPEIELTYDET